MGEETQLRQHRIVWRNVVLMASLHVLSILGLMQIHKIYFATIIWEFFYWVAGGLGITAGVHRLWSHRSYKAKLPLRILLTIFNSMGLQNSIIEWSRDHRVHHKYSETDADPHNAKRGFFFSHVGWLLVRKHPDVIRKGKNIDMSDLHSDPVLVFQAKYYTIIAVTLTFVIPTLVPLLWGENLWLSYLACIFRYCFLLNATWMVNSAAHKWGSKPYEKSINPSENRFVAFFAMGEGFHNYHHVFPHDYSTSEFGFKLNFTTMFIDAMAYIGWAYDCRKVAPQSVLARRERTGDLREKST